MAMDIAGGNALGVHRDDLVCEARPMGLVFTDQLGIEATLSVPRISTGKTPLSSFSILFVLPMRELSLFLPSGACFS